MTNRIAEIELVSAGLDYGLSHAQIAEIIDNSDKGLYFDIETNSYSRFSKSDDCGHDSGGSFSQGNTCSSKNRYKSDFLRDLPEHQDKALEKLQSKYNSNPIKSYPDISNKQSNYSVKVVKNAYSNRIKEEKPYLVRVVKENGDDDHIEGFRDVNKAIKSADSIYKMYSKSVSRFSKSDDCGHDPDGSFSHGNTCAAGSGSEEQSGKFSSRKAKLESLRANAHKEIAEMRELHKGYRENTVEDQQSEWNDLKKEHKSSQREFLRDSKKELASLVKEQEREKKSIIKESKSDYNSEIKNLNRQRKNQEEDGELSPSELEEWYKDEKETIDYNFNKDLNNNISNLEEEHKQAISDLEEEHKRGWNSLMEDQKEERADKLAEFKQYRKELLHENKEELNTLVSELKNEIRQAGFKRRKDKTRFAKADDCGHDEDGDFSKGNTCSSSNKSRSMDDFRSSANAKDANVYGQAVVGGSEIDSSMMPAEMGRAYESMKRSQKSGDHVGAKQYQKRFEEEYKIYIEKGITGPLYGDEPPPIRRGPANPGRKRKKYRFSKSSDCGHDHTGSFSYRNTCSNLREKVSEKIPPNIRNNLKRFSRAYSSTFSTAQRTAKILARKNGYSRAQVNTLTGILGAIDLVGSMTASATGMGTAASFVPVASSAYLIYSASKNPMQTYSAARHAVKRIARGIEKPS